MCTKRDKTSPSVAPSESSSVVIVADPRGLQTPAQAPTGSQAGSVQYTDPVGPNARFDGDTQGIPEAGSPAPAETPSVASGATGDRQARSELPAASLPPGRDHSSPLDGNRPPGAGECRASKD